MTGYDWLQMVADTLLAHMLAGAAAEMDDAFRAGWCCQAIGYASL